MKRLWRVGAFGWLGVALLVPVLLAQVVEDDIGIEIGKAASAEAQMEIAREKHFTERDYPGAIEAYDEVVNLFPTSDEAPEALFRVGNIHHWRLIDPAEAITSYHRLVDTYPESDFAKEAWIRIGEAYGRDDRWRDALSAFQEAVDRHPGTDYATWALLEIASTHYSDLADPATAAPMYETVQRDAPGTRYAGEARLRLSVMAYLAGGIAQDEAVLRCRTVADGAADDALLKADALFSVATLFTVAKRYQESLAVLDEILAMESDLYEDALALTYLKRAICYRNLGQDTNAQDSLEAALTAYPTSRWRGMLQGQLRALGRVRGLG